MTVSTDGGRGRTFVLAASVALLLLGAVALVWVLSTQQGSPPAPGASEGLSQTQESATSAPDQAAQTAPPDTASSTQAAPDAGAATTQPDKPEAAAPKEPQIDALPQSAPVSIDIPSIDVTSQLHPLGLNDDGTLQVPTGELYDQAAWYDGSPTPGELGPSVIEGHVTSQGSTPSIFFDLGELGRGDTVDVTREDGSVATFKVYATDSFPKDDFPKVAVYGNTEVPELRLITCGGDYDADARAHVDNIVVFAKLVPQA
ncbi:MAG: class F sortase [Ornithinimicrobium sp.]|jgi:sortase (surface protein transpeptidase)|uniref:class F sortase n=1 Tax=Ornithinimicrobium sp. TaxID=1977084 RepID=UPI003D9BE788